MSKILLLKRKIPASKTGKTLVLKLKDYKKGKPKKKSTG